MADDNKTEGVARAPASEGRGTASGAGTSKMEELGGSWSDAFNMQIVRQTTNGLYFDGASGDERVRKAEAALVALSSVAPRGELEGMLGAQLISCHNAAMHCFHRATDPTLSTQLRGENLAHAARLTRSYAALVEALERRRGETLPKTVVVEHRVVRSEGAKPKRAAQRIGVVRPPKERTLLHKSAAHKGNGHGLNGHKALNGGGLNGGALDGRRHNGRA